VSSHERRAKPCAHSGLGTLCNNALSGFPLSLSANRAPVAQRTERVASDHQVAGSNPAGRAITNDSGRASVRPNSCASRVRCARTNVAPSTSTRA
jgi:hypothetical protein